MRRLVPLVSLATLTLLAGCANATSPSTSLDAAGSDGGGVCCPRDPSPCTHSVEGLRAGGWASDLASCAAPVQVFDGVWGEGEVRGCPTWEDHFNGPRQPGDIVCGAAPDAGTGSGGDGGGS